MALSSEDKLQQSDFLGRHGAVWTKGILRRLDLYGDIDKSIEKNYFLCNIAEEVTKIIENFVVMVKEKIAVYTVQEVRSLHGDIDKSIGKNYFLCNIAEGVTKIIENFVVMVKDKMAVYIVIGFIAGDPRSSASVLNEKTLGDRVGWSWTEANDYWKWQREGLIRGQRERNDGGGIREGEVVFLCTSKYVGEYCQHLNPCHTGPRCQNGGSCRVKESSGGGTPSFACSCPVGFTASLCEIPIENACDSSPCLNGATCNLKSLREYVCTCATGYTGEHCERQDHCASSPCRNGAECLSLEDSYKCTCAHGFTGPNCADDIDECDRNPCRHGSCKNIHGSYKCICSSGYTGQNCENEYIPCDPSPCKNGGTCRQIDGLDYECTCPEGDRGKHFRDADISSSGVSNLGGRDAGDTAGRGGRGVVIPRLPTAAERRVIGTGLEAPPIRVLHYSSLNIDIWQRSAAVRSTDHANVHFLPFLAERSIDDGVTGELHVDNERNNIHRNWPQDPEYKNDFDEPQFRLDFRLQQSEPGNKQIPQTHGVPSEPPDSIRSRDRYLVSEGSLNTADDERGVYRWSSGAAEECVVRRVWTEKKDRDSEVENERGQRRVSSCRCLPFSLPKQDCHCLPISTDYFLKIPPATRTLDRNKISLVDNYNAEQQLATNHQHGFATRPNSTSITRVVWKIRDKSQSPKLAGNFRRE
ncbi:Neurogenic locus Notch protein [Eufriesea mexicana]|uniref:Neurogenic locus Notch protein n=1 Tax=Eufriesea mexicana TaxID=516756 RepID=A0A310S9M4_9HYME|nr:Neurogenic locus Notch protein [Eufriesea mexicana]